MNAPEKLTDFCSLEPAELDERIALIRRELAPNVRRKRRLVDGVGWDFDDTQPLREQLEQLARLERQCCTTMEFDVLVDTRRSELRFEIHGIDPETTLFDALGGPSETTRTPIRRSDSGWRPFAKAGGIAAAISLLLCCVAPLALVVLFGAAVAAPFTKLDNPWIIGTTTLTLAVALWFFERRRTLPTAPGTETDTGCGC